MRESAIRCAQSIWPAPEISTSTLGCVHAFNFSLSSRSLDLSPATTTLQCSCLAGGDEEDGGWILDRDFRHASRHSSAEPGGNRMIVVAGQKLNKNTLSIASMDFDVH
jgi:hypothetical protein